jgi:hypothetical protein
MDINILIPKQELIKIENENKIFKIIIITLIILCILLLSLAKDDNVISPNNRKSNINQNILFLNEQYYYNSLCCKDKKIYRDLTLDEKIDSIKTNLIYKILK